MDFHIFYGLPKLLFSVGNWFKIGYINGRHLIEQIMSPNDHPIATGRQVCDSNRLDKDEHDNTNHKNLEGKKKCIPRQAIITRSQSVPLLVRG